MNPFITGKYVILNGLDANDAQNEQWFGLSNDRNIAFNSPNMYRLPNNSEKQLSYFNTLRPTDFIVGITSHEKKDELIGIMSIKEVCRYARRGHHATIFNTNLTWTIKQVIEAHYLVIRHAFHELNYNCIAGGSIDERQSVFMTGLLGFKKEGIQRQLIYRDGRYHDCHIHSLLSDEFEEVSDTIKEYLES